MQDTLIDPPLRARARRNKRVSCPESSPLLQIRGIAPGSHTLAYCDSNTLGSRRKPDGAICIQVFVAIADRADAPLEEARFYRNFTTSPAVVSFDAKDNCKIATYYARWSTRKGECGPWSMPVSMTIAAMA